MRRGPWHQFGDRSQRLVIEQIDAGVGVGVIISPRDLALPKAVEYSGEYHARGVHVLVDQQFYNPNFSNAKISSYFLNDFRTTVSQLHQISDAEAGRLARGLESIHRALQADGIIAPAVVYEAGRPDIVELNSRLFRSAKAVGDGLGIPTYGTVVLGSSAVVSEETISHILSHATSLNADGWYYGFEFGRERVPSSQDAVLRCCSSGLTLACTGKPVLHAYAGPMALLSLGFGATAAAIGHSQNLWHFTRGRWENLHTTQGGGGDAPPRFFSASLWGTVVYPDEIVRLPTSIAATILTPSPFAQPVTSGLPWNRWDANKHLVYVIGRTVADLIARDDPRDIARAATGILRDSVRLHSQIATSRIVLSDFTNAYQENWLRAMRELVRIYSRDFDYLDLLR